MAITDSQKDQRDNDQPSNNQRRHKRLRMALPVHLQGLLGGGDLITTNISRSGVFLRTDCPLPERQILRLHFRMPDQTRLEIMGVVVHRFLPGEEGPSGPGMGIDFFALSKQDRQNWDRFCLELERKPDFQHSITARSGLQSGEEAFRDEVDLDRFYPIRRRNPRFDACFIVRLRDRRHIEEYYLKNISLGGMFVKTSHVQNIGDRLEIILIHPDTSAEFSLGSEVLRVTSSPREETIGMALQFLPLEPKRQEELKEFITTGVVCPAQLFDLDDDSVLQLENIVQVVSPTPRAYAELGKLLLEHKEDPAAAVEELHKALDIDPDYLPAHRHLRLAYALLGDREKALQHVRIVRKLENRLSIPL